MWGEKAGDPDEIKRGERRKLVSTSGLLLLPPGCHEVSISALPLSSTMMLCLSIGLEETEPTSTD
jgi:hypothetical protein